MAFNISDIIDSPGSIDQLRALSADELKQLKEEFPYVPLYKVLLAKVLRDTGRMEMGEALKEAALQAPDRTRLYHFLHFDEAAVTGKGNAVVQNEIGEIQALNAGADNIRGAAAEIPMIEAGALEAALPVEGGSVPWSSIGENSTMEIGADPAQAEEKGNASDDPAGIAPDEIAAEIGLPLAEWPDSAKRTGDKPLFEEEQRAGKKAVVKTRKKPAGKITAAPDLRPGEKHTFLEWLALLEGRPFVVGVYLPQEDEVSILETQIDELSLAQVYEADIQREVADMEEEDTEPGLDADVSASVKDLADKSLSMNTGIVTETLARLMLMQGKKRESIALYEQLRLKYPEKSDYFAAQIEAIRRK